MLNWIDFAIIGIIILFAVEGKGRSFVGEVLDFISFIAAFLLSVRFYNLVGKFYEQNFQVPHSLGNVLGFISVWFLSEIGFFVLINLAFRGSWFFRAIDKKLRLLSIVPAMLRGVVFVAILLLLVGIFPIQPRLKKDVQSSKIGAFLLDKTALVEAPLKNVFGGISQDTLTFLTVKPKSGESVKLGFQTTEFLANAQLEEKMVGLISNERQKQGLKTLSADGRLQTIARLHSSDMFKRGYFSHFSPEGKNVANRATDADYDFKVIGENLAYAPTLELAHRGLMNSPGHRANILSEDYQKMGIGIMDSPAYGLMITQVFSN